MAPQRYSHFTIYSVPNPELGELLTRLGKTVSEHKNDMHGHYYYVNVIKPTTLNQMKKLTGCTEIYGELPDQDALLAMTRSSIALAKKEYDELIKKGRMILQVLNESETSEDILSSTDRRALTAYKKYLAR